MSIKKPNKEKVTIITSSIRWWDIDWNAAWAHRELFWLLMWRSVTIRYTQMVLGVIWSLIEPLALLLTLTIVFGLFVRVPTDGLPYALMVFSALLPWLMYTKATMNAVSCLFDNMALISKIHFPRLLLPFASVFRDFFDSLMLAGLLIIFAWFYGYEPSIRLIMLVPMLLAVVLLSISLGLWLSGLMVRFRDIRLIVQILLQIGFYLSPVLFPPSLVPERFQFLYQLNPLYWAIETSRWIFIDKPLEITLPFYYSIAMVLLIFFSGLFIFTAQEKRIVDVQ